MSNQNLGADKITANTNATRDSWQEALSKWQTVPASKVAQAAEVIRGLAGSWAASYQFDAGLSDYKKTTEASTPNPQQIKTTKIGQPGFPEINFVPYNWGTNRFANKGGSLVGHPISFSVVGPTAKNSATLAWQWLVTDNSATPGAGDILTLNQTGSNISQLYGITSLANHPGGLYIVVSMTGESAQLTGSAGTVAGGVGDGSILDPVVVGYIGVTAIADKNAKYEIFRVVLIRGGEFILDPAKRLASYFTIPGNPVIRAITVIQPQATRLVAVPGSSVSGSPKDVQAFAVVPPRRALGTDEKYPYTTWVTAPWNEDLLADYQLLAGDEFTYKYGPKTPIPRPLGTWQGRLHGINPTTGFAEVPAVVACKAGTFILHPTAVPGYTEELVGKILHVKSVKVARDAAMTTGVTTGYQAPLSSLTGWFEVTSRVGFAPPGQPDYWVLRRLEENNPSTGSSVTRAGEYYTVNSDDPLANKGIFVEATVHEPVTSLWDTTYPDIDKVDAARLTNLIDPRWTARSGKNAGINPSRADRAVFNTATSGAGAINTNADPGSLLDLGFRMVLFRAKNGTEMDPSGAGTINTLIPDWANPVASNEILLDPTKPTEKQYVEVDYANGLVRLSHPIKTGSPLYPADNIFTYADNPRGEMVVFACCIPYSMEEGQLGSNVRVTGGVPNERDLAYCGDTGQTKDTVDVFSERLVVPCDVVSPQTIPSRHVLAGVTSDLVLRGDWRFKIPATGFFELVRGLSGVEGSPAIWSDGYYRGSLFGYQSYTYDLTTDTTILHKIYGGGWTGTDSWTINSGNPTLAVFRREVRTPNDTKGTAGIDYQFDTTYGAAKRASAVRFDDANLVANADGSVTVRAKGTQTLNLVDNFDDMFASCVLVKGTLVVSGVGPFNVLVPTHTILMRGQRMLTQEVVVQLPAGDDSYYIYYQNNDGKTCPVCTYTTDFPLADPNDILLAKIVVSGGGVSADMAHLQNPLKDLDRRLDIYVGEVGDWAQYATNFATLWEAVQYANEMMSPDSGGLPYKNCRIQVIGRTTEPGARLPIVIKTNGLVIEGVPFKDNAAAGLTVSEISWMDATKDLIDLNGRSDLVFRNLSFRFQAGADPGVSTNSLFVGSSSLSSQIIIDNCRAVGYVKHFIKVSAFGLSKSVISNNRAMTLAGSGFYNVGVGATVTDTRIENNVFGTNFGLRGTAGIEILGDENNTFYNTNKMTNVVIRNNYLTGFNSGIWVGAGTSIIDGNYITNTYSTGIVAAGGAKVTNNSLLAIHTDVAPIWTAKYGILVFTKTGQATEVSYNTVDMDGSVVDDNDDAIHVVDPVGTAAAAVNVGFNHATRDGGATLWYIYVWAWAGTVQGNISQRVCVDGKNNSILGNSVDTLTVNFDPIIRAGSIRTHDMPATPRNYVRGNEVQTGYLWLNTTAEGNSFRTAVYFRHDCKLSGNYISSLRDFSGFAALVAAPSQKPIIIGNEIVAVATGGGTADQLDISGPFEVVGNQVTRDFEVQTATNGVVGNNRFTGKLILGKVAASSNFTVTGNWIGVGGLVIGAAGQIAEGVAVTGNKMVDAAGTTGLVVFANSSSFTGNSTNDGVNYGAITVTGSHNNVGGNTTGYLTAAGGQNLIQNNKFFGDLIVTSAGGNNLITGNFGLTAGRGKIKIQCSYTVITGNHVIDIEFADALENSVISGNMLTGDIVLGSSQANQVDPVVVVGNIVSGAGGIATAAAGPPAAKATSAIVAHNQAAQVFDTAPVAGNVNTENQNN